LLTVHEIRRRDVERAKRVLALVEKRLRRAEESGSLGREKERFRWLLDDVELAREQYQAAVELLASLEGNAQPMSSDAGDQNEDHSQSGASIEPEARHGAVGGPACGAAQGGEFPSPEEKKIPQPGSEEPVQHQNPEDSVAAVPGPRAADDGVVGGTPSGAGGTEVRPRHQRSTNETPVQDAAGPATGSESNADSHRRYQDLVRSVERLESGTYGNRVEQNVHRPVRLADARKAVLLRSGGRCENPDCGGQPSDVTDSGQAILEVDHVVEIAAGGRDNPEQMVALCPNCHAMKTRGRSRESLRSVLMELAAQRHAEWMYSRRG
jgi:5-methylcytosine-specific restriction endonuclease McrA